MFWVLTNEINITCESFCSQKKKLQQRNMYINAFPTYCLCVFVLLQTICKYTLRWTPWASCSMNEPIVFLYCIMCGRMQYRIRIQMYENGGRVLLLLRVPGYDGSQNYSVALLSHTRTPISIVYHTHTNTLSYSLCTLNIHLTLNINKHMQILMQSYVPLAFRFILLRYFSYISSTACVK